MVEFDLETLEPVVNTIDPSDIIDEIPFVYLKKLHRRLSPCLP